MAMPALQQKRLERLDLYGLWMEVKESQSSSGSSSGPCLMEQKTKGEKSRGSNSTITESSFGGSESRLSTGKKAVEAATKILAVVLVAETAHGLKDESFKEVLLVERPWLRRRIRPESGETSGTGSGRTSQKGNTP